MEDLPQNENHVKDSIDIAAMVNDDDDYSEDFNQTAQVESMVESAIRPNVSAQDTRNEDQIEQNTISANVSWQKQSIPTADENSQNASCQNVSLQKINLQSITSDPPKQHGINFNHAVMVSSDNMSFQQRSDKADTVAHTIGENDQTGIPDSRAGSRAQIAVSEGTAGGVFSQKSTTSIKTFGGQQQRRPPVYGMINQNSVKGGLSNNQCDSGIIQTSGKVQMNQLLMKKPESAQSQAHIKTRKRSNSRDPTIFVNNNQMSNDNEDANNQIDNDYTPTMNQLKPPRASIISTIPQSPGKANKEIQGSMIHKLLRGFKLQQYSLSLAELGYSQDIFKLAFLSQRERNDLMYQIDVVPAHKERMNNLFKIIEQLNPRQTIQKTLAKAQKQSTRGENRPESSTGLRMRRQASSSLNRIKIKRRSPDSTIENRTSDVSMNPPPQQFTTIEGKITPGGRQIFDSDQTQAYISQLQDDNHNPHQGRSSLLVAGRIRSQSKGNPDQNDNKLVNSYNQLEPVARLAINEQFLNNVKSGRNHQSFHQALQNFQEKSLEKKKTKNAIDSIFPENKFVKQKAHVTNIYLKNQNERPSTESQAKIKRPPMSQASAQKSQRKRIAGQPGIPLAQGPGRSGSKSRGNVGIGKPGLQSQGGNRASSKSRGQGIQLSGIENSNYESPDKQSQGNLSIFTQNKLQQRGHSRHRSSSQQKHPQSTKAGGQRGTMIPLPGLDKPQNNPFMQSSSSKRSREGSNIGRGVDSSFFNKRKNSARGSRSRQPEPSGQGTSATDAINDSQTMNTSVFNANDQSRMISNQNFPDLSVQTNSEQMVNQNRSILPNLISPNEGMQTELGNISEADQNGIYRKSELQINNQNMSMIDESKPIFQSENRRDAELRKSANSFNNKNNFGDPAQENLRRPLSRSSARPMSRGSARQGSARSQNRYSAITAINTNQLNQVKESEVVVMEQEINSFNAGSQTPIVEGSGKFSEIQSPQKQTNFQSLEQNTQPFIMQIEEIPEDFIEAINDFSSPMLCKEDKKAAFLMGQSMNSKKVAQGPAFFNIRIMCHCLGKAMRRHCDFSQDTNWFLDEVQALKKNEDPNMKTAEADELAFSYKFQNDLKIPTNDKKQEQRDQQKIDEKNDYEDEQFDTSNTLADLATLQINELSGTFKSDPFIQAHQSSKMKDGRVQTAGKRGDTSPGGTIYNSMDNREIGEIEEVDERDGDNIDDVDIQLQTKEQRFIEQIRIEEIMKQSMIQDKGQGAPSNTLLQMQLQEKDDKIKELTKMVKLFENTGKNSKPSPAMAEILAVSGDVGQMGNEMDLDDFDLDNKMTRQEFLVAQLDLDPIQSQYSQEQQQQSSYHPNANIGQSNARLTFQHNSQMVSADRQLHQNQTMGNASLNSVSQGVSIKGSSQGGLNASGSIANSAVFKSPRSAMIGKKPPIMSKSQQKFFPAHEKKQTSDEKEKFQQEQAARKEKEKFDRKKQISILKEHLKYFDERYEFENGIFNEDKRILEPSEDDIAAYGKYVTIASKMENETPIMALVYIERLLSKTGILINKYNWKRFLLVCLCVASKVWDDDSLENIHFPKVMSDVSIHMINQLEQTFLDVFLDYDLVIKGSEYAKYYFIMRSLADELKDESQAPDEKNPRKKKRKRDEWAEFPLKAPISVDQMLNLQKNAARAELYLKERYELEVIEALGNKFKAKEQKDRLKKFDSTI